jgi:hypothetical protein
MPRVNKQCSYERFHSLFVAGRPKREELTARFTVTDLLEMGIAAVLEEARGILSCYCRERLSHRL